MTDSLTFQIEMFDADPERPDPASVSAFADAALADLQAQGFALQPCYTGTLGGGVYELMRLLAEGAAANKEIVLALITGVAAPIAGALAGRLKQQTAPTPDAPGPSVTVIVEGAEATVSEPDLTPDALLRRLLAADPTLAQKISPRTKPIVRVRVPHRGRRRR